MIEVQPGMLTGRCRGRVGLFGRVIMQVEYWHFKPCYQYPNSPLPPRVPVQRTHLSTYWRDATVDDLTRTTIFDQAQ